MIPRKTVLAAAIVIAVSVPLLLGTFRGGREAEKETAVERRLLDGAGIGENSAVPRVHGARDARALLTAYLAGEIFSDEDFAALFDKLSEPGQEGALRLDEPIGDILKGELMEHWVKYDAKNALATVLRLPLSSLRDYLVECFIIHAETHAPAVLLELGGWVAQYDPFESDANPITSLSPRYDAPSILRGWAERDYGEAEKWVLAQPDTPERDEMITNLLLGYTYTMKEPEAVDFILERPENGVLQLGLWEHLCGWIKSDRQGAFDRLRSVPTDHPVWDGARDFGSAVVRHWRRSGEVINAATLIGWGDIVPEGKARQQYLAGAALRLKGDDLPEALEVLSAMKEDGFREEAVRNLSFGSPLEMTEWLAGLPESPSRDAGWEILTVELAAFDPEIARKFAEFISDAKRRAIALKEIDSHGGDPK
jgi:hypothetical protein